MLNRIKLYKYESYFFLISGSELNKNKQKTLKAPNFKLEKKIYIIR